MAGQAKRKSHEEAQGAGKRSLLSDGGSEKMTPMMTQYSEIKAANPGCLLFYRMGDFYELFFDDAHIAAETLGITLTKRGKHQGEDIAMCGVPVHSAEGYLLRLIRAGHRVAVCEQMEDPAEAKKRGAKSVVERAVVRLVTPGTLTEETLLDARANNFLTSVFQCPPERDGEAPRFATASVDISTGEFLAGQLSDVDFVGEIVRLSPGEIIVGEKIWAEPVFRTVADQTGAALTPVPDAYFDSQLGERSLKAALGVCDVDGLGDFTRGELSAIAGVLKYIDITQIGQKPHLRVPRKSGPQSVLVIDGATRLSLELSRTTGGAREGSLLAAMDRTVTGAGARELTFRLTSPLMDPEEIIARLDCVGYFVEKLVQRDKVRGALKGAPDIARAYSRISLGRGSPRDLGAIRDSLRASAEIVTILQETSGLLTPPQGILRAIDALSASMDGFGDLLEDALDDALPVNKRDGGFVPNGYRVDLDENRVLRDQGRQVLADLQAKYAEQTGVKTLKVRHNNVLGYFVEVTALHAPRLMEGDLAETFVHRQTLANATRFTTKELSETESKILKAAERALAIELEIFDALCEQASGLHDVLVGVGQALAVIDVYSALAKLAEEQNYVRPDVNDSRFLHVEGGRHPVVEQALLKTGDGPFIENDCQLGHALTAGDGADKTRVLILTGPNMAGKSTYLRQNALIVIMAQMGSFVPAKAARIGVVDRLFSRVGASDDLARGRSTFMVEMVETANILNQAGERSLVILDEIGRGTATYDGLSIAWAAVEYLHHENQCRALFATHYHELTALAKRLAYAANATIEVKDWKDEVVFLHKVVPGAADRSYGIQVAKLAGLPDQVVMRATEVLQLLEQSGDKIKPESLIEELPLFAAVRPKSSLVQNRERSDVDKYLDELRPDEMSPRDALEAVYNLKMLVTKSER